MLYLQRFILTISLVLTLLLAGLVVLARATPAAHAGEIAFESSRDGNHVRRLRMEALRRSGLDGRWARACTHAGWKQIYRVEIEGNAEQ